MKGKGLRGRDSRAPSQFFHLALTGREGYKHGTGCTGGISPKHKHGNIFGISICCKWSHWRHYCCLPLREKVKEEGEIITATVHFKGAYWLACVGTKQPWHLNPATQQKLTSNTGWCSSRSLWALMNLHTTSALNSLTKAWHVGTPPFKGPGNCTQLCLERQKLKLMLSVP